MSAAVHRGGCVLPAMSPRRKSTPGPLPTGTRITPNPDLSDLTSMLMTPTICSPGQMAHGDAAAIIEMLLGAGADANGGTAAAEQQCFPSGWPAGEFGSMGRPVTPATPTGAISLVALPQLPDAISLSALPQLPDLEMLDLPAHQGLQAEPEDGMPSFVHSTPVSPSDGSVSDSVASRSSSFDMDLAACAVDAISPAVSPSPTHGSTASEPGSDGEYHPGDCSGGEWIGDRLKPRQRSARTAPPPPTARRQGAGASRAGAAGKLQRPAPARPRWKCSAEFLVNSITDAERVKLTKIDGLFVPSFDTAVTKTQEKALRKELRKLRNVASAQRSRRNQKVYIEQLETKLEGCQSVNAELKERNSTLSTTLNDALQQLARLRASLAGPHTGPAVLLMAAACVGVAVPGQWGGSAAAEQLTPDAKFRSRSLLSSDTGGAGGSGLDRLTGYFWAMMLVAVAVLAAVATLAVRRPIAGAEDVIDKAVTDSPGRRRRNGWGRTRANSA